MEDVGIFYGQLVHFTVFCYILWTFGKVHGNLVYFFPFWYFVPRKIWQPCGKVQGSINLSLQKYKHNLSRIKCFVRGPIYKANDRIQTC
jgi:hypothetical protein